MGRLRAQVHLRAFVRLGSVRLCGCGGLGAVPTWDDLIDVIAIEGVVDTLPICCLDSDI